MSVLRVGPSLDAMILIELKPMLGALTTMRWMVCLCLQLLYIPHTAAFVQRTLPLDTFRLTRPAARPSYSTNLWSEGSGYGEDDIRQRSPSSKLTSKVEGWQGSTSAAAGMGSYPNRGTSGLPSRHIQHKDIVIIGGGLAGMSAAMYLSLLDPDRQVTILDRDHPHTGQSPQSASMASLAAAGMLAPQAERLPKGPLLDLCWASRRMFADFVHLVEGMARDSGEEGAPYLWKDSSSSSGGSHGRLEPWNVGYVGTGGFLAPAFAGDAVATWAPPLDEQDSHTTRAMWLDAEQVREMEPHLHPDVVGGWWFPEDASVDARRLTGSLRAACVGAGVQFQLGPSYQVTSLDLVEGACQGLWLQNGRYIAAKSVLVANGAWMRTLLPVPIEPHKGQSLSLRMPANQPPMLRRVLFAQDSYIVPKADGRIVIGATVEAGNYDQTVTPAGLLHILSFALQLVPGLKDLPIEETWSGLRPTTPDKGPILGATPWKNLFVAGGYWRNGVLLAPKTGHLIASLMTGHRLSEQDQELLTAFAWNRFTSPEGSAVVSANARYAASMYPIHTRKSGLGVAASVGTELGSYSTARSAREERQRARESLLGPDSEGQLTDLEEATFEKAAAMGVRDANAYDFGDVFPGIKQQSIPGQLGSTEDSSDPSDRDDESATSRFEGTADAYTVGSSPVSSIVDDGVPSSSSSSMDISELYRTIQANKAKLGVKLDEHAAAHNDDERPDPGFRIFHVDEETGETREVPPYTTPGDFMAQVEAAKKAARVPSSLRDPSRDLESKVASTSSSSSTSSDYSEQTYDGYQEILKSNSRERREEELEAMREARRRNRIGMPGVDVAKVGVSFDNEANGGLSGGT